MIGGRLLDIASSLALLMAMAHVLGVQAYGVYFMSRSIAIAALSFTDLGLSRGVILAWGRGPDAGRDHLRLAVRLRAFFGAAILVGLCATGWVTAPSLRSLEVVLGLGLSTWLFSLADLHLDVHRAQRNMRVPAVMLATMRITIAGAGIFALAAGYGLRGIVLVHVLTSGVLLVVARKQTPLRGVAREHSARAPLRTALMELWPITAALLLATLNSKVPTLLLGILSQMDQVGLYGACLALLEPATFFPLAVTAVALPELASAISRHGVEAKAIAGTVLKTLILAAAPLTLGAVLTADRLVPALLGVEFEAAVPPLRLAVCATSLGFLNIFFLALQQVHDMTKQAFLIMLGALAVNGLICIPAILTAGSQGAAFSGLAVEVMLVLTYSSCLRSQITIDRARRSCLSLLAGLAIMALVIERMNSLPLALQVGAAIATYVLVVTCCRPFGPLELAWMNRRGQPS